MKLTALLVLFMVGSRAAAEYKELRNTTSFIRRDHLFGKRCEGTCEGCYGPGNVNCASLTCYNPSAGESCCSDGNYCTAGRYCADIEGGCCNNGQSLPDCAASLGVPLPSSTTASPSATSLPPDATQGSSSSDSTSTSDSSSAANWVSTHKAVIIGAGAGAVVLVLLLACFGIYRRRSRYKRVALIANTPPTMPGQYAYQGNGYEYVHPGK